MMEIFTQAALASRSLPELRVIFRKVQDHLATCEIGSREHFSTAQSLQNVRHAICMRTSLGPQR